MPAVGSFGLPPPPALNVILFASVWVLYGTDAVHGYGEYYFARSNDFWLQGSEAPLLRRSPGSENALVPGMAAIVRSGLERLGLAYGWRQYLVVTIVPYALFVYFVGVAIRRRRGSSGLVPAAAVTALYGSGRVPYMTTWGGYVDGMAYLMLVPMAMLALLETSRHRWGRTALLVLPALIAGVATTLFVDVTRVGTLLMFPLFWMLVEGATGHDPDVALAQARRLRRVFIVAAAFSLLVPNYYVNNGDVIVPPSPAIRGLAAAVGRVLP